jgi:hypothetical protein
MKANQSWDLCDAAGKRKIANAKIVSKTSEVDPETGRIFRTFRFYSPDQWIKEGTYVLSQHNGPAYKVEVVSFPNIQAKTVVAGVLKKVR